jgi:transcriptional regulator with XRE-family HTH domain
MTEYGERRAPSPVGPLLHLARTNAGLSQAQLAERSGLSLSLISKVENGKRDLGRVSLSKLVGVLGWDFGRSVLKVQKEA